MFTYGKGFGDAKVYYRIWNGSSLTVEASMTAPSASYGSSDYPNYTTLASDPNSNSLVLGVTTADATTPKTWLNRWDGASWGTSVTGTVTAVSNKFPGVAVAFERNSGDALAVFGNEGSTWVYYKTWTSTVGWLAVQALAVQVNAVPNTLLLESDPNSNKIMLAAQNASGGLYYALWGGTPPFNAAVQLETNTGGATNYQPFVFLWDHVPLAASQVAASSDDAEEEGPDGVNLGPGGMYLISTDLELVQDQDAPSSGTQKVGMRFNNLAVPQGATINNAYITFRAVAPDSPNTNSGATSLTIRGQAADNPTAFTSTAYNITNRITTTASVAWSPAAWTTGARSEERRVGKV